LAVAGGAGKHVWASVWGGGGTVLIPGPEIFFSGCKAIGQLSMHWWELFGGKIFFSTDCR